MDWALIVITVAALGYSGSTLLGSPQGTAPALLTAVEAATSPVSHMRMCAPRERNTSTKTCVVDGDTLWISGTKYRLESFDTPEPQTAICGGAAEVALAHKASARLLELLNSNVWTMTTGGIDGTGSRTLATIRIDGRDVGDILIAERLARHWPDGDEWWCR
jgi:micrococcal nuclease